MCNGIIMGSATVIPEESHSFVHKLRKSYRRYTYIIVYITVYLVVKNKSFCPKPDS